MILLKVEDKCSYRAFLIFKLLFENKKEEKERQLCGENKIPGA